MSERIGTAKPFCAMSVWPSDVIHVMKASAAATFLVALPMATSSPPANDDDPLVWPGIGATPKSTAGLAAFNVAVKNAPDVTMPTLPFANGAEKKDPSSVFADAG